jgi:anti-sigma factor RsiW
MAIEREVAGVRCTEVLAELSDYLDGELDPGRRSQVAAHLRGCDVCARFGGAFTGAIQQLRREEGSQGTIESTVFERLRVHLAKVLSLH